MQKTIIPVLLVFRDVLQAFSTLVDDLNSTSKKYKIPINEIQKFNMSNQDAMKDITTVLKPAELGFLVAAMAGIAELQDGLKNFMNYDSQQLTSFHKELQLTIQKFDKALQKHTGK